MKLPEFSALRLACVAVSLWLVLPAAGHAQQSSLLPANRELNRYGLERAWWSHAVIDTARDTVQYVEVDENNLYVQTRAGLITTFDAETGRRLWSALLGSVNHESLPVSSDESELLMATGFIYALPPAAIYYAFKRYMVGGLTAGAVKS